MENTRASIWRSGNKKNLVIIPGISTLLYPTIWKLLSPSYFSYYAKYFTVNVITFNHLPEKGTFLSVVEEYHKRLMQLQPYAVLAMEEGAFIAQHLATRQALKKLVLVSTSTKSNAKSQEVYEHWVRYVQQDRWQSLHKSMSHYFTNKHSFMKYLFFKKPQNPHQLTLLVEALKRRNSENFLPKINSETLIIGGDKDALISPDQYQKLLRLIPKSQLICVRGGCHHLYHQKKSTLEPNILHFLLR
ncbi:alpha/beta fold hydrolase [Candidatus Uabimicrobium amorphum]|uniref:Hydrolase n=1 Tax=Uabimicrobium amorphum TaxID=2596890 RepID=A0A5S9IK62_UABAM|nr:alpha/beta hydrolase [Candidatus Uabimicrobium amorphum]BBM82871.1 hydrolase [Candidatus Uabimicrobium amorphum]